MSKIKCCWDCSKEVPYQEYNSIDFIPKCPHCGALYPEKPKDEALLSIYQDDYLADRSDKNFNKLFNLISKVTFNIICHKLKCSSSYEGQDDIWDKVQWTLEKLTRYYREKPNFKITTSFIQYIGQVVLYPLYNKDEQEKNKKELSIHTPKFKNSKDKSTKELCDYLSGDDGGGVVKDLEKKMDYESDKLAIVKETENYLNELLNSLYDYDVSENSKKSFRDCYYMANLYKWFICGETEDKIVEEIINSLDFDLIKKFNESKNVYKEMLIECANGV